MPDPFPDRRISRQALLTNATLSRIADKVDADESVDLEWCSRCARDRHDKCVDRGYWTERSSDDEHRCPCDCWLPNDELDPAPDPELDEWRTTYGRLDIPVRLIDWRPIAAGIAALTLAVIAHRTVRHGR